MSGCELHGICSTALSGVGREVDLESYGPMAFSPLLLVLDRFEMSIEP